MVIGQNDLRLNAVETTGLLRRARKRHHAPPRLQLATHSVTHRRVVVDRQHRETIQARQGDGRGFGTAHDRIATRQHQRKGRPAPGSRIETKVVPQQLHQSPNDRQPQPEALLGALDVTNRTEAVGVLLELGLVET